MRRGEERRLFILRQSLPVSLRRGPGHDHIPLPIAGVGIDGVRARPNLFISSGVVEAGCKAVIGQQLKQSGMHWTVKGADAILILRCAQASSQWEVICDHRHNQTAAT